MAATAAARPCDRGERIRTGEVSALELAFEDGSSIFLDAGTTLELAASRQGPLHLLRDLYLLGGRTINRIRGATGREQRSVIRTPAALSAVRGTDLRVSSDATATTRTEVLTGVVDVEAMGAQVAVGENEGTAVPKGAPPLPPRKLLPPPTVILPAPDGKLPLEVGFSAVAGAVAYRVLLTRDPAGRDIVREETIRPATPLAVRQLAGGSYYLLAMSVDDAGITGPPGEPVPLRIGINPLPDLQPPGEAGQVRATTATLAWPPVEGAAGYRLQLAADEKFTDIVTETVQPTAEYRAEALAPGTYFFRIRLVEADGYEGAWSDSEEFTVVPPPPAPTLETPACSAQQILLRWSDLGSGYTYRYQIARDRAFSQVIADWSVAKPEIVIAAPEKHGTYFVRARAIDAKGYAGDFSRPQTFRVERPFPYGVLLLIPLGVLAALVL